MSAGRGKVGLVIVLALVAMAMASMLFLRNQLSNAASAKNADRKKSSSSATPKDDPKLKPAPSKDRLAVLIVDPFARSAPYQTAIAEAVSTSGTASNTDAGRNLPPPSFTPIDRGESPVFLSPAALPGSIPTAVPRDNTPVAPAQGEEDDAPPAAPIQVQVRGIVGADRPRAFLTVNGSTRTVQTGSDLGDGVRIQRVTSTHVVIERNGKSISVPVGKETYL